MAYAVPLKQTQGSARSPPFGVGGKTLAFEGSQTRHTKSKCARMIPAIQISTCTCAFLCIPVSSCAILELVLKCNNTRMLPFRLLGMVIQQLGVD